MNDADHTNDTEPTGCPLASEEGLDPQAEELTAPSDAPPEDVAASSREHDTDDFLRWLPTMSLGYRRRAELVERPSSDGADFAAYACEGPLAAASARVQPESGVRVDTLERDEGTRRAKGSERDAATVVTRKRSTKHPWRSVGWGVGLIAIGAALAAWAHRPPATEKAPRVEGVATSPVPIGLAVTAGAAESMVLPFPTAPRASAPASHANPARAALPPGAPPSDAAHKREAAGVARLAYPPAKGRAAPPGSTAPVAAKDQYFEVP